MGIIFLYILFWLVGNGVIYKLVFYVGRMRVLFNENECINYGSFSKCIWYFWMKSVLNLSKSKSLNIGNKLFICCKL